MSHSKINDITRRNFIAGAAATAATPMALHAVEDKKPDSHDGPDVLQPRTMGRVKFKVPAGGFGTLATASPQIMAMAIDKGFYFVHSSPSYNGGRSYKALREVLKDKKRRDKVVIALKINPDRIDKDLKYFGLDHVDMIVPPKHSVGHLSSEQYINSAVKARKAGKVRGIGWACHSDTPGTLEFAAKCGEFDAALIAYKNTSKKFMDAMKKAKEKGLGVFAMKFGTRPNNTGKLQQRMKWLLDKGMADSVLLSFSATREIDDTLGIKLGKLAVSEKFSLRAGRVAEANTSCSWCGECVDCDGRCPNGVAIPQIMRYDYYLTERNWRSRAVDKYASLGSDAVASACEDCGECEKACPFNLPVRSMLKSAHRRLV